MYGRGVELVVIHMHMVLLCLKFQGFRLMFSIWLFMRNEEDV